MAQFSNNPRNRRLIILVVTAATLLLLAAGLSGTDFRKGDDRAIAPFSEAAPESGTTEAAEIALGVLNNDSPFSLFAFAIAAALLLFGAIRYPSVRNAIIMTAVAVVGIYLFYLWAQQQPPQEGEATDSGGELGELQQPEDLTQPPDFVNNPTDWVTTLISVGIAIVGVGAVALIWNAFRPSPPVDLPPLDALIRNAQGVLVNLQRGEDVHDAVMRCYVDMTNSLLQTSGIRRAEGMTPREFELRLAKVGMPEKSVMRLTRLFERVRYGGQASSQRDRLEAIACMEEIIAAAQRKPVPTPLSEAQRAYKY